MLHAARKVFSNVKSTMAEEWSPNENETLNPIKPDDVKRINFSLLIKIKNKKILFRHGIKHVFLVHRVTLQFSWEYLMLFSCFPIPL